MPPVRALPQVQHDQQDMLLRQLKGMLSHWNTGASDTCPVKAALAKIDMARSALQLFTARSGPYKEILEDVHTHLFNTIELLDDRQQHLAASSSIAHSAIRPPNLIDQMPEDGGLEAGADGVTSQLVADKRARHLDRQLQRAADSHECNLQALREELAAKDAVIANLKDLMHMQETRRIKGAGGAGVAGVYDSRNEPQLTLDDDPSDDLRFPSDAEATIRRLEKIREHDTAIGRLRVCQEENSKLQQHISSVKELNGRYAMQASELAARVMALRDHNDRLATSLALRQDEFMQLEKENEVMKAELTDLSQVGHAGRMNFLLDFGGGDDSPINELTTPREGDVFGGEKSSTGLKMHSSMSFSQVAELRYAVYCIGSGMAVPRHLRANGILTRVRLSKEAALFAVADILSLRQIPRFPPIAYTIAAAALAPPKGAKRMSVKRQSSVGESGSATFQTGKYVDLPTFTFNYLAKRHGVDAVAWGYALDDCTRLYEADVNLNSFGQVTRGAISELIFRVTSTDIVVFLQLCERLDIRTVANKRRQEEELRFQGFSRPFGEQSQSTAAEVPPVAVEESPFSEPPAPKPTSRGVKFVSRTNSNASGMNPRHVADAEPSMTLSSRQVLAVLHEMYPGYPDSAFRSLLDSLQSSLGAENTVHYQMMFPNAERIHLQGQADFGGGVSGRRPESGFTPRSRGERESLSSMHTLSTNNNITSTSDYTFLPSAAELRPENSFSNLFKMLILDDAVVTTQTVCDAISGIPGAKVSMFDINDAVRDAFEGRSEVVVSELLSRIRQAVHVITMGGSISGAADSTNTSNSNSNSAPSAATPTLPVVLPPVPKVDLVAVLRVHLLLRQSTIRPHPPPATPPMPPTGTTQGGTGVVEVAASDDGIKSADGTEALATTSVADTIDAEMEASSNSQVQPTSSTTVSRVQFDALLQRPFFREYAARLEVLAEEDVGTLEMTVGLGLDATSLNAPNKAPKIDPLDPVGYELDGLITEADIFARNHASLAL